MDHVTLDAFDMEEARTMSGPGLASFYNLIYADRGWKLPKHLMPVCNALADTRIDKLMLILGPGRQKPAHLCGLSDMAIGS